MRRQLGLIVLVLGAVLLIGCGLFTLNSFRTLIAGNEAAGECHLAIYHLERAMSALKDIRGTARAVMFTGDSRNGPDVHVAISLLYSELAEVKHSLGDDPELAQLTRAMDAFVLRSQNLIAGGRIAPERVPQTLNEERSLQAEITARISGIEHRELDSIAADERAEERHVLITVIGGGMGAAATLLMMALTMFTLRRQIVERTKARNALSATNEALTTRMAELQYRSKEIQLLSDMSEVLQVSSSLEETGTVLPMFMSRLFPGFTAAVYALKSSRNQLDSVACWGDEPVSATFAPTDCWALRKGRMHVVTDSGSLVCNHVNLMQEAMQICIPMVAQGDAIGILYLRAPVKTVADQISLALANLRLQETLRTRAVRDPLTNLFNRRYLEESLEREIHRAHRNGTQLGVMMLDLDHFKRFNDMFGHAGGDALLQQFAHMVQTLFRDEDIVCRYGGEEFAVMLPETNEETVRARAEELRSNTKNLHARLNGQPLGPVTVSVGIAVTSASNSTAQGAFAAADHALYEAKRAGRDRVVSSSGRTELRVVAAEA
jgi:diguanylate cyclase (GGDEF)-like protein